MVFAGELVNPRMSIDNASVLFHAGIFGPTGPALIVLGITGAALSIASAPAGARALADYIDRFYADRQVSLIYGAMRDKAVAEIDDNVTAIRSDVSNLEDLDRLYKEVAAKKGKIDIVFANAGIVETVTTPASSAASISPMSPNSLPSPGSPSFDIER